VGRYLVAFIQVRKNEILEGDVLSLSFFQPCLGCYPSAIPLWYFLVPRPREFLQYSAKIIRGKQLHCYLKNPHSGI
jgi:hypothetical protein